MDVQLNFGALEAGFLNVANFRFAQSFPSHGYGASFPYWSLSLEEQFYLLFPMLIFVSRKYIGYFAIGLILLQWALQEIVYPVLMHTIRTDGLLFGVLIAICSTQRSYSNIKPDRSGIARLLTMIAVWVLLMLLACATAENIGQIAYHPAPVTVICTGLVLIASFDGNYILPHGLLKRTMMWIGSRSYALYLIHIPTFFLTREIWFRLEPAGTSFGGTFTFRFVITALILMGTLSELNYRLVEYPLRVRGAKIAARMFSQPNAQSPGGTIRLRWLLTAVAVIWIAILIVADAGRRGSLDRFVS